MWPARQWLWLWCVSLTISMIDWSAKPWWVHDFHEASSFFHSSIFFILFFSFFIILLKLLLFSSILFPVYTLYNDHSTQRTVHSDSFPLMTDHDPHVLPAKKIWPLKCMKTTKVPSYLKYIHSHAYFYTSFALSNQL